MSSSKEDSDVTDRLEIKLYGPDGKLKQSRDSKYKFKWYHYVLGFIIFIPWAIWNVGKYIRKKIKVLCG